MGGTEEVQRENKEQQQTQTESKVLESEMKQVGM